MRRVLALFGVLLVAALLWWVVARGSSAPPDTPVREVPAAAQTPAPSRASTPEEPERIATPIADPVDAVPLVEVQVRIAETGAPAPGAEVTHPLPNSRPPDSQPEAQRRWSLLRHDSERHNRRYGGTVLADAGGVARVPLRWGDITGRLGRDYGELYVDPESGPPPDGYVLELERDYSFRVRVIDAVGRPAIDVPIVLQPFSEPQQQLFDHYGRMSFMRTEAPDGIALLTHLQGHYRQVTHRPEPPTRWAVNFKVPGWSGPGVAVDPWDPPADPIELQLPPTGTVELSFTPVPGTELPMLFGVQLVQRSPDGEKEGAWPSYDWRAGVSRFLHVLLARSFMATGTYQAVVLERVFDGPTAQDEVVRVDMSPGPDAAVLRGRAVDGDRKPFEQTRLNLQFQTNYLGTTARVTTDRHGWFHFVAGLGEQKPTVRTMRIELVSDAGRRTELRDLGPLPAGITSLGDVVLVAAALAKGRVLLDGEPCKRPPRFRVQYREPGADQWRLLPESRVVCGDGGNFTVHGQRSTARYRLRSSDWYGALPMAPLEFEVGAQDLVVSLRSGSRLHVAVRSPLELPEGSVRAILSPTGAQVPEFLRDEGRLLKEKLERRPWVSPDGTSVTWPSLWPGPYRLELVGTDGCSLASAALEVHAGADNRHVVEIAGPLHHHRILLLDASGEALARRLEPRVVLVPETSAVTVVGVWDGRLQLITRTAELHGLVGADGYRTQEFRGLQGEATFVLEPVPTVDLGLRGGLPAVPVGHRVRLDLMRSDRSAARNHPWWERGYGVRKLLAPDPSRGLDLDAWGRCRVPLGDGSYLARVHIWLPGHSLDLPGVEPLPFTVDHGMGDTRFDLDVPTEAFRAALAKFAERGK